ncbi:MAG: hypothetical protein J6Y57_02235, partial [Lachnospiraceae bacterium]|nr:hypothetical protein [Lachnospiraceae bacterium]
ATLITAQAYNLAQARAGLKGLLAEYVRIARGNVAACKDLAKANPAFASWVAQAEAALAQAEAVLAAF